MTQGWRHSLWMAPLAVALAAPGHAQTPKDSGGLDEVVVTARKREETLLQVPLAVTAITADQIQREGVRDIEDIIARDPSLRFDSGIAPYDTRIVIRGLSPTRGRPNVAALVDGIDVSSESIGVAGGSLLINPRLIDIERIEIVKGPQSALYGRSAFAGAINYVTAGPAKELSGSVSADYNQHDYAEAKASLSLPLSDTLGIRLNGYKYNDGGFYKNSNTGASVGGGSGLGGSLSVNWAPNELYTLKFRTEYSDDGYQEPAQANVNFNGRASTPAAASSCRVYTIANPMGGVFAATGPVLDPSCVNLDANALVPGTFRNPVNRLEAATGNVGYFNDANIPAYRGSLGSSRGLAVTYNPDFTRSTDNGLSAPEHSGSNRQVLRLSGIQSLQLDFGTFSSLTGYTRAQVASDLDFDKTTATSIMQNLKTSSLTEQFSQELRFTSDFDGRLQFVGGLQYWTERMDQQDRNDTVIAAGLACVLVSAFQTSCAAPAFGGGFTSTSAAPFMDDTAATRVTSLVRRQVRHQSAYLEFEWRVFDTLKLIGEGRYVDEDNTVTAPVTAASQGPGTVILCGSTGSCNNVAAIPYAIQGAPATFSGAPTLRYDSYKRNDSYLTPKATIQWQPNERLNVYGSYSEGEKPGGFGTLTIGAFGLPSRTDVEFLPERVKVYELGAKWASADRKLFVDGALFKQDFTDKQVSSQVIIGTTLGNRITNAGGAEAQGMELATQWRATDRLTLGAGVAHFFKYEFTNYTTITTGAAEIARVGNCTPVVTLNATGTGATVACQISRNGNKMEDVAETAISLNAGWRQPIGGNGWNLAIDVDASHQGKQFIEDDNTIWLEPYWLGNLRFGFENERMSVQLYVNNLTDDRKLKSAGTGPGNSVAYFRTGIVTGGPPSLTLRSVFAPQIPTSLFATLPDPRTVGLRVNYKF